MREYFHIEKKEVITINVKHAMYLDKQRITNIIKSISDNSCISKLLKEFFAHADGSRTFNELGKSKEYICYVLTPKISSKARKTHMSLKASVLN